MALREVLASLDVVVRGVERVQRANAELDKTKKSAGPLENALGGIRNAFAALGAAIVARRIVGVVGEVIALGDSLTDASVRLGISTQALQEWHFAAERSGMTAEQIDTSIGRLNRTVGQAVRGGGSAAQTFRRLGIRLRDSNGQVRSTGDIFGDTITAMAGLGSAQERAAVAQQLFGRAGQQMLPLIAEGAEGVAELRARFHELGGGLSEDVIANAAEADDAMKDFDLALTGIKGTLVAGFLPAITRAISGMAEWIGHAIEVVRRSSAAQAALALLTVAAGVAAVVWGILNIEILVVVAAFVLLFLAVEDVWTALSGGDSIFGRLVEWIAEAMGMTMSFQSVLTAAKLHLQEWGVELLETFASVNEAIASVLQAVGVEPNMRAIRGQRETATRARQEFTNDSVNFLSAEFQRQEQRRGSAKDVPVRPTIGGLLNQAFPAPVVERRRGRGRGREGAQRPNVAQTNHFNINGGNPQEVRRVVEGVLRQTFRTAAEAQPTLAAEET